MGDAGAELRRVLRRDGRLMMSDVLAVGTLPDPLDSVLGWMACTAGALESADYRDLVTAAGFEVLDLTEHREAVEALVA